MPEGKSRVDFNAPDALVEEADAVAELLDTSRTNLLIDALRSQLEEISDDEAFRRRLKEAYYSDRMEFDTVETVLGREEAMRLKLLRRSLRREPPVPEGDVESPPTAEFYDGDLPEWRPDDAASDDVTDRP